VLGERVVEHLESRAVTGTLGGAEVVVDETSEDRPGHFRPANGRGFEVVNVLPASEVRDHALAERLADVEAQGELACGGGAGGQRDGM